VKARLTLVTLDCRAFAIATSVGRVDAAVYSPAVLRRRGQACLTGQTTQDVDHLTYATLSDGRRRPRSGGVATRPAGIDVNDRWIKRR
jgi:hypothetical protein